MRHVMVITTPGSVGLIAVFCRRFLVAPLHTLVVRRAADQHSGICKPSIVSSAINIGLNIAIAALGVLRSESP
jgi:hypothetical protein